jgi:two-component system NtrC family sensor kinase
MKKLLLFLVIFCLFQHPSYSQDQHLVDSLLLQLKKHNEAKTELRIKSPSLYDTTAANILNALAKAHWGNNPVKAIAYGEQSLQLSRQLNYKKGIGNAYNSLGVVYKQSGNYSLAADFHTKSLKISEEINDKAGIAFSYLNLGNIFFVQGNHSEALKNFLASLKISEETGDQQNLGWTYSNIGNISETENNYPEALKNYRTALAIFEAIGDKKYIAGMNLNIAGIYVKQGYYPEAIRTNARGLKAAEEVHFIYGIANSYFTMGDIQNKLGNFQEALKNFLMAAKLFEETSDILDKAECYIEIGNTYSHQKNYSQSREYLSKALSLSKNNGSIEDIKLCYSSLAKLDSLQGNLKQELDHYKLFIIYSDSLAINNNTKKTTQQQMQFDFDKKQVADSLEFASEKKIGEIKLQKQKAFTYGGFIGIIVTILLLFSVYRNYKKQRLVNQKLKEAQELLIRSEKMAAFGIMASRVSHEIQNPLNFVNNFSELSRDMVEDIIQGANLEERRRSAEMLISNLEKINQHGKRADSIVKQLQEHTNKGTAHEFFEGN